MVHKLTLDGGLLRGAVLLPAVHTLKQWEAEGKVELFESDRAKETNPKSVWLGPKRPYWSAKTGFKKKAELGPLSFQSVATVIFPGKDPIRLNMAEINEVAHILRHHALGRSIFVTTNAVDFITNGKREHLQAAFNILVLTPDETVDALKQVSVSAREELQGTGN